VLELGHFVDVCRGEEDELDVVPPPPQTATAEVSAVQSPGPTVSTAVAASAAKEVAGGTVATPTASPDKQSADENASKISQSQSASAAD